MKCIAAAGAIAVALVIVACGPIEVSDQQCVDIWNERPGERPELAGDARAVHVNGEGEHDDLGFGSCWVQAYLTDGDCGSYWIPVGPDAESLWARWDGPMRCSEQPVPNTEILTELELRLLPS